MKTTGMESFFVVGTRHLTRHGNPTNSATVPTGSSTPSMRFNGSDAFYQTNFAGLGTDVPLENFILSCDVNIASQPAFSFPVAIGRNGGGMALLQEGGNWKIIHQGVAASPPGAPIQLNTWTHLDLVRSNGVSYLYVNGTLNLTFNSTPNTAANFLTIGANQRGTDTVGDAVMFTNQVDNVSMGRRPDGSASIIVLPSASPRTSNGGNSAPAPFLSEVQVIDGNQVRFMISTVAGHRYQVEYKDDLGVPVWTPLAGPLTATGPTLETTDTASSQQRFYRVMVLP